MTTRLVPTQSEVDATHAAGAEPATLCINWRRGCNGVTDGAINGELRLCESCRLDVLAKETERQRANYQANRNRRLRGMGVRS